MLCSIAYFTPVRSRNPKKTLRYARMQGSIHVKAFDLDTMLKPYNSSCICKLLIGTSMQAATREKTEVYSGIFMDYVEYKNIYK